METRGVAALAMNLTGHVTVSLDATSDPHSRETAAVGFDATRSQRRRRSDIWVVAAAVGVCLILVLWALLG